MRLIETLFSQRLNSRLTDLRPRLFRTALGLCGDPQQADDLVQVAFEKALAGLHRLKQPESLEAWVFSILTNCHRDQCRRRSREEPIQGRSLKVEVVANNQGIRMLQKGISPVADRIQELNARYNNLRFAACGNTMDRLRREQGENIVVLPEAVVIKSGVSFVTRRQQEGWVYIKA